MAAEELTSLGTLGDEPLHLCRCTIDHVTALVEWTDRHLRPDYFFRPRHLLRLATSPRTRLFLITHGATLVGFVCLHETSRLYNLFLAPTHRNRGIGALVIRHFQPRTILAKTNMAAGDPVPFYLNLGYKITGADIRRPHILELTNMQPPKPSPFAPITTRTKALAPDQLEKDVRRHYGPKVSGKKPAPFHVTDDAASLLSFVRSLDPASMLRLVHDAVIWRRRLDDRRAAFRRDLKNRD